MRLVNFSHIRLCSLVVDACADTTPRTQTFSLKHMSIGRRRPSVEDDDDWEIITAQSSMGTLSCSDISWSFGTTQDPQHPLKQFHGSLFINDIITPRSPSSFDPDDDSTLNSELVGVQAALDVLRAYERSVGILFTPLPIITPREQCLLGSVPKLGVVDNAEAGRAEYQERWREFVDDLMNPELAQSDSLSGSFIDSTDLHQSRSTSSDGSAESFVLPETPKAKPLSPDVLVNPGASPDGQRLTSPGRLNALASSFVPTFLPQPQDEPPDCPPHDSPRSRSKQKTHPPGSFTNFTFPSLNPSLSLITSSEPDKDELIALGLHADTLALAGDLLPPFLHDSGRGRPRKSRTRELVDRLRSQGTPAKAGPASDDATFSTPKATPETDDATGETRSTASVSENRTERELAPGSSNADEEGWIDVNEGSSPPAALAPTATTLAQNHQKANRARELFLALTRRRTNSSTDVTKDLAPEFKLTVSLANGEENGVPGPKFSAGAVAPLEDGWIEGHTFNPAVASGDFQQQHRAHAHTQKKHKGSSPSATTSNTSSRPSHSRKSSTSTGHVPRTSTSSAASASAPSTAFGFPSPPYSPAFYFAYPAMGVSMPVAYGAVNGMMPPYRGLNPGGLPTAVPHVLSYIAGPVQGGVGVSALPAAMAQPGGQIALGAVNGAAGMKLVSPMHHHHHHAHAHTTHLPVNANTSTSYRSKAW